MPLPRILLFVAFVLFVGRLPAARADEPFFKKGDVIAIVGGEDMVAMSEYGYLELLLTRALPDYHLRFRNLAWEGDTVFEQRRDLNFPPWEEQLEKIGATVVLCQFGQMESLGKGEGRKAKGDGASKEEIAEFIAAYEKLIARFSGGGKRRVAMIESTPIGGLIAPDAYGYAQRYFAKKKSLQLLPLVIASTQGPIFWAFRDGVHLDEPSHERIARFFAVWFSEKSIPINESDRLSLLVAKQATGKTSRGDVGKQLGIRESAIQDSQKVSQLRQLITAKNRLWFDYWRVQNWAFLAGDRTNQPSSRDHLDPKKRWFPEERERFLPLIEAREKEIDALAAKLAQP